MAEDDGTTTIEVRDDQWKDLNALKEKGDSFKDVIDRLLVAADRDRLEPIETPDLHEPDPDDEVVETPDEGGFDTHDPMGSGPEDGSLNVRSEPEPDDPIERAIEAAKVEWDDDGRREQRADAVRAVIEYMREHDGASRQELKDEVEPDAPVSGQNPRTWYRSTIRPVLNRVAEYDNGAREYHLEV